LLTYYGVSASSKLFHFEKAHALSGRHRFSHLDQLQTAGAAGTGATVTSFNKRYANIEELSYMHL